MDRLRTRAGSEAEVGLGGVPKAARHGGCHPDGLIGLAPSHGGRVPAGGVGVTPGNGRCRPAGRVEGAAAHCGTSLVVEVGVVVAGLVVDAATNGALVVGHLVGAGGIARIGPTPAADRRRVHAVRDLVVGATADQVRARVGAVGGRLQPQRAGVVDPQVERLIVRRAEEVLGARGARVAGQLPVDVVVAVDDPRRHAAEPAPVQLVGTLCSARRRRRWRVDRARPGWRGRSRASGSSPRRRRSVGPDRCRPGRRRRARSGSRGRPRGSTRRCRRRSASCR